MTYDKGNPAGTTSDDTSQVSIEEMKTRYLADDKASRLALREVAYYVFDHVLTVELRPEAFYGAGGRALPRAVDALQEVFDGALMITVVADYEPARLVARVWRPDDRLREQWSDFLERRERIAESFGESR